MTVTVLGIGLMGAGMARSLGRAGLEVTLWNRTPVFDAIGSCTSWAGEQLGDAALIVAFQPPSH